MGLLFTHVLCNSDLERASRFATAQAPGTLPLRERRGEQGVGGVDAAIQAEVDRGGAGVVGVLDELLHDRRPLRVVHQYLADPPSQVNLLAEVFQKDRHRVRRRPR